MKQMRNKEADFLLYAYPVAHFKRSTPGPQAGAQAWRDRLRRYQPIASPKPSRTRWVGE